MDEETLQREISPISALSGYVAPLRQIPTVILQLLLYLCVASLATCNKLFEIFDREKKSDPG
jgi:hypothetical protein